MTERKLLEKFHAERFITVTEANTFENYYISNKRHKQQKRDVNLYFRNINVYKNVPIVIKLIRISPRKLDSHDNLPMAFKYVVDAIADLVNPGKAAGRADDSKLIQWEFDQEKGKPKERGVRVEVYER